MKRFFRTGWLLLAFAACDEGDVRYDMPSPPDTMHLGVSAASVVLDPARKADEALRFTWGAAAAQDNVAYYFKMDLEENNFTTSIDKVQLAEGVRTISFTHKQLNDLLGRWGVEPGGKASLIAEVIAETANADVYRKPEISRIVFEVQSYTTKLYLMGSATGAGDDPEQALPMRETVAGQCYEWFGRLDEGGICFPLSQLAATPAYGRGEDNATLAYYETGDVPCIEVSGTGYYTVSVDVDARTVALCENVYIVGDGCPAGWNMPQAIALKQENPQQRIFTYCGMLYGDGLVKFPLQGGVDSWSVPFLMPVTDRTEAAGESAMEFVPNGYPDKLWKVPATGLYTATLDLGRMTAAFEYDPLDDVPFARVWIVGDATPGGWYCPFRIELRYDPAAERGTFVWDGELTAGEFKFPLGGDSWDVPFLMPKNVDGSDHAPLSETELDVVKNGQPDKKWLVDASEAGHYRISVNVKTMRAKFEKLN